MTLTSHAHNRMHEPRPLQIQKAPPISLVVGESWGDEEIARKATDGAQFWRIRPQKHDRHSERILSLRQRCLRPADIATTEKSRKQRSPAGRVSFPQRGDTSPPANGAETETSYPAPAVTEIWHRPLGHTCRGSTQTLRSQLRQQGSPTRQNGRRQTISSKN